ncbi:hypothetical protein EVAR_52623_1 [Eumeta japonica]|uniref:Uncharacterized protein n=1 Tax=Eumeta variegata TaxID=151549 RepID=A0A4C1Y0Y2_EUMVA|nr:hypothetical protein EVAR_52623_1 [Eumeta japonica]
MERYRVNGRGRKGVGHRDSRSLDATTEVATSRTALPRPCSALPLRRSVVSARSPQFEFQNRLYPFTSVNARRPPALLAEMAVALNLFIFAGRRSFDVNRRPCRRPAGEVGLSA